MIITDISKLRKVCDNVDESDCSKVLDELNLAMKLSEKAGNPGIGLAAPQIGIYKRAAIIRIQNINIDLVSCNITNKFGKINVVEGCLSIPGRECDVERANQIVVKNNNLGSHKEFCAYGIAGVCIQHEMDHWDGVLMIDKEKKKEINIGPNQPCPCGKLDPKTNKPKKYKKCCGRK